MKTHPAHKRLAAALFAALAVGTSAAQALTIDLNPVADTFVARRDGFTGNSGSLPTNDTNFGTSVELDLIQYNTIYGFAYVRFDLSTLGEGATINSVSLTFTKTTNTLEPGSPIPVRNDTIVTGRFAAYGLNDYTGNTAQNWGETDLTFSTIGGERIADIDTQFDTVNAVTSFDGINEVIGNSGTTATISSDAAGALATFLAGRLNASTFGGLATFIVDFPTSELSGARAFAFASRENTTGVPVLTIDYTPGAPIPEPSAFAALAGIVGLGFAASRRRRAA